MVKLLRAAVAYAKEHGAKIVEGYPSADDLLAIFELLATGAIVPIKVLVRYNIGQYRKCLLGSAHSAQSNEDSSEDEAGADETYGGSSESCVLIGLFY